VQEIQGARPACHHLAVELFLVVLAVVFLFCAPIFARTLVHDNVDHAHDNTIDSYNSLNSRRGERCHRTDSRDDSQQRISVKTLTAVTVTIGTDSDNISHSYDNHHSGNSFLFCFSAAVDQCGEVKKK
jgi:hypothetical protein